MYLECDACGQNNNDGNTLENQIPQSPALAPLDVPRNNFKRIFSIFVAATPGWSKTLCPPLQSRTQVRAGEHLLPRQSSSRPLDELPVLLAHFRFGLDPASALLGPPQPIPLTNETLVGNVDQSVLVQV